MDDYEAPISNEGKLYCALMAINNYEREQDQWSFITRRFGNKYFTNGFEYAQYLVNIRSNMSQYVKYQEFRRKISVVNDPIIEGAYKLTGDGKRLLSELEKLYN